MLWRATELRYELMDAAKIAALGMTDDLARLRTISHNIANALTPAYKKQVGLSQANFASQVQAALDAPEGAPSPLSLDTSGGTLRYTGQAGDVAIEGEGFFEVMTPQGPLFSRQGSLQVDAGGRLVGPHGMPVMGQSGEIVLANAPFAIGADGTVRQGERVAGRLKLVRFEQAHALLPQGAGLYQQGQAQLSKLPATAQLRAHFQENSNVSTAAEMVRLSETVRHFESLQRIVQGYDEALEKSIRKLGEF